jgi:hypothetical protein
MSCGELSAERITAAYSKDALIKFDVEMTITDFVKKCKCKHAKADVHEKSLTMNIVCTKKGKTTDPVYCALCKEREEK